MSRSLRLLPVFLLVALSGFLGLSVRSDEGAADGKKYALLIGVRDYDHASLKALKYTENDVEALSKVLEEKGGFSSVRVLSTTRGKVKAGDAPTGPNVRLALKGLLAKKKNKDIILIGLAGHGVQLKVKADGGGKKDEGFFCPSDSQLNDPASMLSLTELFDDLKMCGAGVKLLLMDACRNDVAGAEARNVDVAILPRPPKGMAALFSCASGERAYETPKLGTKGHGVFFHYVLKGLAGDARNKRGEVTWDHLTAYVKGEVPRAVVAVVGAGAQQSPHLVTDLVGEPPVLVQSSGVVVRPREKEDDLKMDGPVGPPSRQFGKLKASKFGEEGIIRFAPAFTGQPAVTFSNTYFAVVEVKRGHFRWRHVDNTPSEGSWTARGPAGPTAQELTGDLKASVRDEEGEVRFSTPFVSTPEILNDAPQYFQFMDVTRTGFRWKHLDNTPSTGKWAACGIRSGEPVVKGPGVKIEMPKNALTSQSGPMTARKVGQEGVVRFVPPFKERPTVVVDPKSFDVVEVTTTEFRWKHREDKFSLSPWIATGIGAGDALIQAGEMKGTVRDEEGEVRFPAPFATPPVIEVYTHWFEVLETTKTGFRWKHLDNTPTPGFWWARGTKLPEVPPATTAPQAGPMSAKVFGEEGVVRFPAPFTARPTVELSKYFTVVEVTPTQFKWRHIDNTPSVVIWRARLGAPEAAPVPVGAGQSGPLSASTFGEEGVIRFPTAHAVVPTIAFSASYFQAIEVTKTQFRWRHVDSTPSKVTWSAAPPPDTLRARVFGEEGVVRFPVPYAAPPTIALSNHFFRVTEVTKTEFRWRHTDKTPSSAGWSARVPGSSGPRLGGLMQAKVRDEEGIVRFSVPYGAAPTVRFSNHYFALTEVTRTHFRWKHLDNTPSAASWMAEGPNPFGRLTASVLDEEGVVRFPGPYAAVPRVTFSNFGFRIVEVTKTELRWKHIDTTPSASLWTAEPQGPDALELTGDLSARDLNEEGLVNFTTRYVAPPTVALSNAYFRIVEVTPTHFRWRHLDNTPSTANWTAQGVRAGDR